MYIVYNIFKTSKIKTYKNTIKLIDIFQSIEEKLFLFSLVIRLKYIVIKISKIAKQIYTKKQKYYLYKKSDL